MTTEKFNMDAISMENADITQHVDDEYADNNVVKCEVSIQDD